MPEIPKQRSSHERGLERPLVVRAALELLNEVGYSGLTVRCLAERLGVKAAALYWHFKNKQDLINAMAQAMLEQAYAEADLSVTDADWHTLLHVTAVTNRRALTGWRDGAQLMAHADITAQSSAMEGLGHLVKALMAQGFSFELAMSSLFTIVRYTLGCVFEEQTDPRSAQPPAEQVKFIKQFVKTVGVTLPSPSKRPSADEQFERGLEIILAGIAARLDASRSLA